jgi:glycosyltransferase involved in cell wall biosynthesis
MEKVNQKFHILFVTSDKYPPFRPAARVIFGEELVARGHVIDWLIQAESNCDVSHHMPYGNGTAYVSATDNGESRWRRLRKHLLDLKNDLRMFFLVRRNRYHLIQVKDKYIAAILAIFAAKLGKAKFFYWLAYPHAEASLHDARENFARYRHFYLLRGYFFKFVLYKIILPAADHIFVQSEQMKQDISREGVPLSKMTPIPGSLSLSDVPYENFDVCTKSIKSESEKHIVYLGTLLRTRRLDFIIRAHAKVIERHPNAKLLLVGKGEMPEDEQFLVNEANRLGVRNSIIFTGYLSMKKAWELIRNADVCLSPYYPTPILNSTSPTKLIEYMAMGKAVVGNDHPEQSLVVSESSAGLCVSWSEDAFADAINTLLNDPVLAKKMGARGRLYVEQYRTNKVMAEIIEGKYRHYCN